MGWSAWLRLAPDGEDVAAGVSEDCNDNLIPDECEATPLSFGSERLPRDSDTARLTALAEGDFDDDGDLDLAVGVALARSRVRVTIFLNDGAGGLAPGSQIWEIENEVRINVLRTGDVNGDGVLDVVFLGNNAPYVLLLEAPGASTVSVKLWIENTQAICHDIVEFHVRNPATSTRTHREYDRLSIIVRLKARRTG